MKAVVESGGRRYPLFMGFLAAEEIRRIASAPSFSPTTSHRDIAANILEPPVEDWQRPLDEDRLRTIRRVFDNSGALMPNPVLLSANGIHEAAVRIEQERAENAVPTDIWAVRVEEPLEGQPPPLWILDGQHRIYGLAASRQGANQVPVVLLLNDGRDRSYSASDFAELFAQVTTTARKLEPLHNEWLTYSFDLEAYASAEPNQVEHKQAMTAVAELCKRTNLTNDIPNPFANGVRFNPENAYVKAGGFSYSCIDLKELVRKHYYAQATSPLPPIDLAEQIAQAYLALKEVVRAPHEETVFFGGGDFAHCRCRTLSSLDVLPTFVLETFPIPGGRY
jgi:DGQHR domain-containing protein